MIIPVLKSSLLPQKER